MQYRTFGRLGWQVSEVGYGMWGLAGWSGSAEAEFTEALHLSVDQGVNFFDTAWAYGDGLSERYLGQLLKAYPHKKLYVASKIPPKNRIWPAKKDFALKDVFPKEYIAEYVYKSLDNLAASSLDLMQLHVWSDHWAEQDEWKEAMQDLKSEGVVQAWGISVNRWEPENVIQALGSGLIDAVQVIYNIFDQNPEDTLFPYCVQHNIAVIARVPFDEGSLTGTLTPQTTFPPDDWRSRYFCTENLIPTLQRVDALKAEFADWSLPELALRFSISHPAVSTSIPGMRRSRNVLANTATSDGSSLPEDVVHALRKHRWERRPAHWSD